MKLTEIKSNGIAELIGTKEDIEKLKELRSEWIRLYADCSHLDCNNCPLGNGKRCLYIRTSNNLVELIELINVKENK